MAFKLESLWPYPQSVTLEGEFPAPQAVHCVWSGTWPDMQELQTIARLPLVADPSAYPLTLTLDASLERAEAYRLTLDEAGACLSGADEAGLAHGFQTLLQVLVSLRRESAWPVLRIEDWPTYRRRAFMVDLGRSVYNLPFLQRIVRILARLKLNELHVHLYDDELCGLRFAGLPFGTENPYSLSLDNLAALVEYAARYHVALVPELEGWGHVGALVYHRPELRGGEGMYAGSSFLVGPEALALMRELVTQVVAVMPSRATIHLGLDEALWFLAPNMPPDFTPQDLVAHYYEMLQEIGAQQSKELTLQIWADHGGRPVPPQIRDHLVIQPWQYWIKNRAAIDRAIERYSGADKLPWMIGAGQSSAQYRGAYHATRYWCQRAASSPNVAGVDITQWESNDLDQRMLSLFAGAYYAWNPAAPTSFAELEDYEVYDREVFPLMYAWQSTFRDAFPDALREERGPLVERGFYLWGPRHGQPVAPTVLPAKTALGHDYLNEVGVV